MARQTGLRIARPSHPWLGVQALARQCLASACPHPWPGVRGHARQWRARVPLPSMARLCGYL